MATFFMFGTYSSEALKAASSERTKKAQELFKSLGGEIKSMYALLGKHDLVLITELPGIEQAVKASIELNHQTGIAFTTMPALSVQEFDKLTAKK